MAVARSRGTTLPEGAIATSDGRRSNDPAELEPGGALLPAAGHKGFGLSAMVEALSMSLTGAGGPGLEPQEGALVICLGGGAFQPAEQVAESLDGLRRRLRESSSATVPVLAPGDPEAHSRSAAADIVTVESAVIAQLAEIGRTRTPGEEAAR